MDKDALSRENGYRMAQLDLLDILLELKGQVPSALLEHISSSLQERLQIRELNNFSVHETDLKGK